MINPPESIPVTNWDAARAADSSPGTEVPRLGYAHNLYLWSRAAACTYLVTARTKSVQVRPKSPSPSKEGAVTPRARIAPLAHLPLRNPACFPSKSEPLSHKGDKKEGQKNQGLFARHRIKRRTWERLSTQGTEQEAGRRQGSRKLRRCSS